MQGNAKIGSMQSTENAGIAVSYNTQVTTLRVIYVRQSQIHI